MFFFGANASNKLSPKLGNQRSDIENGQPKWGWIGISGYQSVNQNDESNHQCSTGGWNQQAMFQDPSSRGSNFSRWPGLKSAQMSNNFKISPICHLSKCTKLLFFNVAPHVLTNLLCNSGLPRNTAGWGTRRWNWPTKCWPTSVNQVAQPAPGCFPGFSEGLSFDHLWFHLNFILFHLMWSSRSHLISIQAGQECQDETFLPLPMYLVMYGKACSATSKDGSSCRTKPSLMEMVKRVEATSPFSNIPWRLGKDRIRWVCFSLQWFKKKWCFLMRKTMANDWLKKNMATSDDRLLILSRGVPVWIMSDPTLGNLIFKSRPIQSGATEALKTLAPNITPHVI